MSVRLLQLAHHIVCIAHVVSRLLTWQGAHHLVRLVEETELGKLLFFLGLPSIATAEHLMLVLHCRVTRCIFRRSLCTTHLNFPQIVVTTSKLRLLDVLTCGVELLIRHVLPHQRLRLKLLHQSAIGFSIVKTCCTCHLILTIHGRLHHFLLLHHVSLVVLLEQFMHTGIARSELCSCAVHACNPRRSYTVTWVC